MCRTSILIQGTVGICVSVYLYLCTWYTGTQIQSASQHGKSANKCGKVRITPLQPHQKKGGFFFYEKFGDCDTQCFRFPFGWIPFPPPFVARAFSRGCLLPLTWTGQTPVQVPGGQLRFLLGVDGLPCAPDPLHSWTSCPSGAKIRVDGGMAKDWEALSVELHMNEGTRGPTCFPE